MPHYQVEISRIVKANMVTVLEIEARNEIEAEEKALDLFDNDESITLKLDKESVLWLDEAEAFVLSVKE